MCKKGARSNVTFASVSADRFVLLNQKTNGGVPSLDWIVITTPLEPLFCVPGDSGAWVYDAEGCLLGHVIGQALGQRTAMTKDGLEILLEREGSWTYITPIEATLRDIERTTGCRVTLDLGRDEDGVDGRD